MQVAINKKHQCIIALHLGKGKQHDFKIFKLSSFKLLESTKIIADSGYQGLKKIHPNSKTPVKKSINKN